MEGEGVNELQGELKIPSSAEEGGPRHQEKIPNTLFERPGWCWSRKLISLHLTNTTPSARRMVLRDIFLIAQPPLLC